MSANVEKVMTRHHEIAERYALAMENAEDKSACIAAMNACAKEVKAQYADLENISSEYTELMTLGTASEELKEMVEHTGKCFGSRIAAVYPKMAMFLSDEDFRKAHTELDIVLSGNPLFGGAMEQDGTFDEVAKSFAHSVNSMAEKLNAEVSEADDSKISELEAVFTEFDSLAKRYKAAVEKADTTKKFVKANDLFVEAVRKLIPRMKDVADTMRLLSAKRAVPESVAEAGKSLRNTLGKELKEVLQDKRDLMADMKVKKSVEKLGKLLETLPF